MERDETERDGAGWIDCWYEQNKGQLKESAMERPALLS